jgi:diguanylate cyclase (GGDEF)-like protein/PAS domain S-box-containing protein
MSLYTTAAIVAATIYVALAAGALARHAHRRRGRLFATICVLFGVWSFGMVGWIEADSLREALIWQRFGAVGWTLCPLFLLRFFQVLTSTPIPHRRLVLPLTYLPAILIALAVTSGMLQLTHIVETPLGWREVLDGHLVSQALYSVYYLSYVGLGLTIVVLWSRRHPSQARRHAARLIVVTAVVSLVLAAGSDQLVPLLGIDVLPPLAPLMLMPWTLGMAYASERYHNAILDKAGVAEDIVTTMPLGIITVDLDGTIRQVNHAAELLLGLEASVIRDVSLNQLLPRAVLPGRHMNHRKPTLTGLPWRQEIERHRRDGTTVRIELDTSPLRDRDGDHVGYLVALRDVTAERAAQEQLHHLATHDVLTGLPNRRLFEERVQLAAARARRHKRMFAVMVLDLDGFKPINDDLGHEAGDEVLCNVAGLLRRSVRDCDTVARMGGDEFLVLLDELNDIEGAETAAERILHAFEALPTIEPGGFRVRASIGSAAFPFDAKEVEGLLRKADEAMYASKAMGGEMYTYCQSVGARTGKIIDMMRSRS